MKIGITLFQINFKQPCYKQVKGHCFLTNQRQSQPKCVERLTWKYYERKERYYFWFLLYLFIVLTPLSLVKAKCRTFFPIDCISYSIQLPPCLGMSYVLKLWIGGGSGELSSFNLWFVPPSMHPVLCLHSGGGKNPEEFLILMTSFFTDSMSFAWVEAIMSFKQYGLYWTVYHQIC